MDCERPKVRVNELWIILSGFGYGFLLMWLLLSARTFVFSLVFQELL